MAKERKNEILEEQRKARQEFLELKKIQHGEIEAPPKPSEEAVLPKTRKEKWDNFWFHYKWHTIAAIAVVSVLAIMITQCATRKRYDLEVVLFSYHLVLDEQSQKIADYLSKYADDVNGDGEINVQVINCSFDKSGGDLQYERTILTKLQALIAGDENALLFITDTEAAKYLETISEDGFFEEKALTLEEGFYDAVKMEGIRELPKEYNIACRRVADTVIAKKKGTAAQYEAAKELLEKLKDNRN